MPGMRTMDNPQVTERDLIWLACFIDCEGTIQLVRPTAESGNAMYYHTRISTAITDARMVEEVQQILRKLGCNPYIHEYLPSKGKRGNAKNAYHITLQRFSHVKRVLEAILPYLILKDAQARLLLDFIALRTDNGTHSGRKKKGFGDAEHGIWQRVRSLNARGTSQTARAASLNGDPAERG